MKNKKQPRRHMISLAATEEEMRMFEVVKHALRRKSSSDLIRFLVNREAEKILSPNMPVGIR